MKYLLKEKIPHTDYEVGHVFEQRDSKSLKYSSDSGFEHSIPPHEILLLVNQGILEEVKEEVWPKEGGYYWFINDCGEIHNCIWRCDEYDKYRQKVGIWQTEAEAQAALERIMNS